MNQQKFRLAERFLFMILFAAMIAAFTSLSAKAAEKVSISEGTYYIKAINGNAKGQVLYWDEKTSDQNKCMMFESQGGKHADYEIWYITKNRNFDDYYGIYLYKTYTGNKDKNNRIEIDNITSKQYPYIRVKTDPHVFCGPFGNQDDAFEFMRESGTNNYSNLSIWSKVDKYRFNRHKVVKPFKADLIYINANKDKDTNNKLWELVPVNYERSLSKAALSVTAKKKGKVTVNWKKFIKKIKKSEVWKKAKYIQIQYSTDKTFSKKSVTKTKKFKKKKINKAKAKSILSKLKKKKKYYFRVRLIDSKGVCSNWSKTIKIKTKK